MASDNVFASYKGAEDFITAYEKRTSSAFTKWHMRNHGIDKLTTLEGHRIWWEDNRGEVPVTYDGIPFVCIQTEVRQCHQGQEKKKKKQENNSGHGYNNSTRCRIQPSKKLNCLAKIRMKMMIRFPEYRIDGRPTEWRQRNLSKKLKQDFCEGTKQEFRVIVRVQDTHEGHVVGELSGYGLPLHAEVREKITSLVEDGITNAAEIGRFLERETEDTVPATNRRFRPTVEDIRNHVTQTLKRECFSEDDQKNLIAQVNRWKEDMPEDSFFFRPASTEEETETSNSLLFLHQSSFQKGLLLRYGQELVLMDSTYKTTKYDIPLFIICVSTNVGYASVGFFLVSKETIEAIQEALQIIKNWNPHWKPKSFICDFDKAEISAVEHAFQGIDVFTCDFHREQSWLRWFNRSENNAVEHRESVIKQLRKIAHSNTEAEYQQEVQQLKATDLYQQSHRFRNWIEKQWLNEKKRWVYCFRKDSINIQVSTTNGVEALNKKLKYSYLKSSNSGSTLTGLVKVLIEKFEPDCKNLYIRNNISCLSLFKKFSKEVPPFLVEKPKKFVTHCMKRMTPDLEIQKDHLIRVESGFQVLSPSGQEYFVCLSKEVPYCTCPDWRKFHWPCKHMLAIFVNFPDSDWSSLSEYYKSLPWFNLDETVTSSVKGPAQTAGEHEISENVRNCTNAEHINTTVEKDQMCKEVLAENNIEVSEEVLAAKKFSFEEVFTETEANSIDEVIVENNVDITKNSLKQERYNCLSVVKNIQSAIHCTHNLKTLQKAGSLLKEAEKLMSHSIPKLSGLPLRSAINRRRQRMRVARKNNMKKVGQEKQQRKRPLTPNVQTQNVKKRKTSYEFAGSAIAPDAVICSDSEPWQKDTHLLEELKRLWREPADDLPVVQIGPHTITKRSLHYIQTSLSDDVIDATLSLLVKKSSRNVLHIDLIVATVILQGHSNVHNYLVQENFNMYDLCIGAVNEGGSHWVLMIIIPSTKSLVYLNPLGELESTEQTLLQNWYKFMHGRFARGIEPWKAAGWTVSSLPHSKQIDTLSCGVYVLKFAENYLFGRSLGLGWTPAIIKEERRKIALRLLSVGTLPDSERAEMEFDGQTKRETVTVSSDENTEEPVVEVTQKKHDGQTKRETVTVSSDENTEEPVVEVTQKKHDGQTKRETVTVSSDENTEEPVVEVTQKKHVYNLRNIKSKPKRLSFVYPKIKRSRKLHCVCKKHENEELYWQCVQCLEWYHPSCMGLNPKQAPKHYLCKFCRMSKQPDDVPENDVLITHKTKDFQNMCEQTDDSQDDVFAWTDTSENVEEITCIEVPPETVEEAARECLGLGSPNFMGRSCGETSETEKTVESDESDGDPDESTYFIDTATAQKNIDVVFSRVENIIKLREK